MRGIFEEQVTLASVNLCKLYACFTLLTSYQKGINSAKALVDIWKVRSYSDFVVQIVTQKTKMNSLVSLEF